MKNRSGQPEGSFYHKLKWLVFLRLIFTTLLLLATIAMQLKESPSPLAFSLLFLYGLTCGIFIVSFFYSLILRYIKHEVLFAYIQIGLDTVLVSLIIFVTGGFSSIFLFLYLVVIIYSGILLFRKGSMIIAAFCSIQYCIIIVLEYYDILRPIVNNTSLYATAHDLNDVLYKMLIALFSFFSVAFLSSLLSEEVEQTKKKLKAMEARVKQVEKLAVIGKIGAGLAHELKNPLASLTGSIQMLKEKMPYDSSHNKLIQIFLREANRLNDLVNSFLLFAKPPEGNLKIIELDKEIREAVELFEKDVKYKQRISFVNDLSSGIWIEIDPGHLRQILWNLILNAAQSVDGAGQIKISMHSLKGNDVEINISDNGCGMSSDVIQSMFEPFYTTKKDGTGLGLSIVNSIIESYDSIFMTVDSEINTGSTFTLRMKRVHPSTVSPSNSVVQP
jgi:two-component system sensor histidine kinase HydH